MKAADIPNERIYPVNVASERLPLLEVLDRVIDKGIVITYDVDVSVVGLRAIEITGRVVVASIETYLRTASALSNADEQVDAFTSAADAYLRQLDHGHIAH